MCRRASLLLLIACLSAAAPGSASAQVDRGFDKIVPSTASGIEINRQRDLWVMEVQYKPVRLAWVDFTDPETGETVQEPIWYLVYRAIPRPLPRLDNSATTPQNDLDVPLGPSVFIPEFTLMTLEELDPENPDNEIPVQLMMDEIILEALPVINEIERERGASSPADFLDSVSLVDEVMDPVAPDAEVQPWIYGVATWRGVDPQTDFFKIQLEGFSNGYELRGDENDPSVWRKAIVQRFSVQGDEFDESLKEFEFVGDPQWIFVPDQGGATE
jgi:hypothetical protein